MGKWWVGGLAAIGWMAASAAADAQPAPFLGPNAPPPPTVLAPSGPPPSPPTACPASAPPPPEAPPMGPGGDRGFDNAFDPPPEGLPPPCWHTDFEYLGWWTRHAPLPVLVTAGSASDAVPGALGQPRTVILSPGSIDDAFHNGGRLNLEYDPCGCDLAVVASGFFLQEGVNSLAFSGNGAPGSPLIARPFVNGATGQQAALLVASPGLLAGTLVLQNPQTIYGGEADVAWTYWAHDGDAVTGRLLFGGRYLNLHEQLQIGQASSPTGAATGLSVASAEDFDARNQWYGGQVGAEYSWALGPVTLDAAAKIGVGDTDETLNVGGVTRTTLANGTVTTTNSSLLVGPTNAGGRRKDVISVLPELVVNASVDLNEHIRIGAGYDLIYVSRVLRPGDQVDPVVGAVGRPAVPMSQSDFWMQGVTATLRLSF